MKTEQNQQELSFEELLGMNDFSLEGENLPKEDNLDINLDNPSEEEIINDSIVIINKL